MTHRASPSLCQEAVVAPDALGVAESPKARPLSDAVSRISSALPLEGRKANLERPWFGEARRVLRQTWHLRAGCQHEH